MGPDPGRKEAMLGSPVISRGPTNGCSNLLPFFKKRKKEKWLGQIV